MDFLRAMWPSQADIDRTTIDPPRRALWEQRAIAVFLFVGSIALWGLLAWRLARFILEYV